MLLPEPDLAARGRRSMHLLLLYGLLLTFSATTAAAIEQHFLGRLPPYAIISVPVMSGIIGGAGVVVGGIGLGSSRYSHHESATSAIGDSTTPSSPHSKRSL